MSCKGRKFVRWSTVVESSYLRNRKHRVFKAYEIIVPKNQSKRRPQKQKEGKNEEINSTLLSSFL